jgi:hypothetical protein
MATCLTNKTVASLAASPLAGNDRGVLANNAVVEVGPVLVLVVAREISRCLALMQRVRDTTHILRRRSAS